MTNLQQERIQFIAEKLAGLILLVIAMLTIFW
jgi:hypothetical protein